MANQPRFCRTCRSYIAAKQWDTHRRECRTLAPDAIDRVSLVWDDDYLLTDSFDAVSGCFKGLLERGKSFLMVQHIGEALFEIAFIPGGGPIPQLSANQQGLVTREPGGYGPTYAGMYCRQWGSAPMEREQ